MCVVDKQTPNDINPTKIYNHENRNTEFFKPVHLFVIFFVLVVNLSWYGGKKEGDLNISHTLFFLSLCIFFFFSILCDLEI